MNFRLIIGLSLFFAFGFTSLNAQEKPVFRNHGKQAWVDSVFNSMTPDQRLAQLFMVAAYSNRDSAHIKQLQNLVEEQKIGGLIYFQGGPVRQATMCNYLQAKSDLPMLIAMDAEWGLGMRLDSTISYPRQMTLGAIINDELIYDMGAEVARQMTRMGMHINFAPVVDVNSNAANPVIGTRSFGENKNLVTRKGLAYMKGMQDNRVLACAKHFPGHGDTDSDSHKTLPIINHDYARIDSLELFPFKGLIKEGIGSMMVAHLYIPSLDDTPNLASTLSPKIVNGLLRDSLDYDGLIFTDALNMKGVSKYFGPGEVDLKAFLAGNDVMLFAEDVPTAMLKIREAIAQGKTTQAEVDRRCRKVLETKAWAGLDNYAPIKLENLVEDLNNARAVGVNNSLIRASITTLINENKTIPLATDASKKYASVVINQVAGNAFQETLNRYTHFDQFQILSKAESSRYKEVGQLIKDHDVVVVSIVSKSSRRSKNYGVTQDMLDLINGIPEEKTLVINLSGNP
ncbi:MAG: beta-N-acetylhexosaminidase, partial [Flavobacteriales bacterium]